MLEILYTRIERPVAPAPLGLGVPGVNLAGVDKRYESQPRAVRRAPVAERFDTRPDGSDHVAFVRVRCGRVRDVPCVQVLNAVSEPGPLSSRCARPRANGP